MNGPVSLEVVGTKSEDMVEQAVKLHNLGSNAVIKIPMTLEGLKAMKILRQKIYR